MATRLLYLIGEGIGGEGEDGHRAMAGSRRLRPWQIDVRPDLLREARRVARGQGSFANIATRLQFLVWQAEIQEAASRHGSGRQSIQEDMRLQPPRHSGLAAVEQIGRAVTGDRV